MIWLLPRFKPRSAVSTTVRASARDAWGALDSGGLEKFVSVTPEKRHDLDIVRTFSSQSARLERRAQGFGRGISRHKGHRLKACGRSDVDARRFRRSRIGRR